MSVKLKPDKATKKEMEEASVEAIQEVSKSNTRSKVKLIYIILAVGIVVALILAANFYIKYKDAIKTSSGIAQKTQSQDEDSKLIEKISSLVELPKGETPTIATISDITKLSGQPFFESAENGDKVLIYNDARKAYLFRPETGKVINIGPINIQEENQTKPVNVFLLNGTEVSGLTLNAEDILKEKNINAKVLDRDNASKNDYEDVIVVDLTGKNKSEAQKIASVLGGKVQDKLPAGESSADGAEIVVILGSSFAESLNN